MTQEFKDLLIAFGLAVTILGTEYLIAWIAYPWL